MNNETVIIIFLKSDLRRVETIKKWKKTFPDYLFEINKDNSIQLFAKNGI